MKMLAKWQTFCFL